MGAKTLLHAATAQPERIDAMVLVSATPRFHDTLRTAAARFTPEAFDRLSEQERDTLRQRHIHGDDQVRALYAMTRSFATSEGDMAFTREQLERITARTLIVHGDRDPYYPVEMALELFRGIPKSALWVVPYGGHGPVFGPLTSAFVRQALAHLEI
jgi:pimeloyl-ACP methyl ester carboxylesterase